MAEEIKDEEKRGFLRVFLPLRKAVLYNFLGGIAWGFGTVLGATLVVGLVILFVDLLGGVPYLGNIIEDIVDQARRMNDINGFDTE